MRGRVWCAALMLFFSCVPSVARVGAPQIGPAPDGDKVSFRCRADGHLVTCEASNVRRLKVEWGMHPERGAAYYAYANGFVGGNTFEFNVGREEGRVLIELRCWSETDETTLRGWCWWDRSGKVLFKAWVPEEPEL